MKKIIRLYSLILLFFVSFNSFVNSQIGPIVSPIGAQSVLVGGKINIYFSAVGPDINFSSTDLPSFAQLEEQGDNSGIITINTVAGQEGFYTFHLQVNGTTGITTKTIKLEIKPIPEIGRVFYCDPVNGDISNPGDSLNPWGSLEGVFAAFKKFKPGDVIFCRDGLHGKPQVFGDHLDFVTIAAQSGHSPKLQQILINGKRWVVSGMDISPENAGLTEKEDYVVLGRFADKVRLENCKIYSIDDASEWLTNEDWYANAGDGIEHFGKECIVRNNYIKNTNFSITLQEANNRFEYNTIDRFGGDAIRGLADDLTVSHNVIKNAVVDDYSDPGGNHDDAFQSWTFGAPKRRIKIQGNQVFNYTDPTIPLLSSIMQGIVCFDGFTEDWIVENNLVVNDHPHGIALYGTKNCKVVNNTIVRNPYQLFDFESEPWIDIHSHKDGRRSTGNLVRNNIMPTFVFSRNPGTADHNAIGISPTEIFVDYENWDFHLQPTAAVIGMGINEDAPYLDQENLVRPINNSIDLGCFDSNGSMQDFNAPSLTENLQLNNAAKTSLELSWDAATDDIGIAYYEVTIDKVTTRTNALNFSAIGLRPDTEYDIDLQAVDYAGNKSIAVSSTERTLPLDEEPYQIMIPISPKDQQIQSNSNKALHWVGLQAHQIGGVYGEDDGVAVLPFQIPFIKNGTEIKEVNFNIHFNGKENVPTGNVAIYALPAQTIPDVSGNNYWQGTAATPTENGILLMDNFVKSSDASFLSLDNNGAKILTDFIKAQIMDGAKVGDYIFLRLNSNVAAETAGASYTFSSADNEDASVRPTVRFSVGEISTSLENLAEQKPSFIIYPNPASLQQEITLKVSAPLNINTHLKIYDLNGKMLWQQELASFSNQTIQLPTANFFPEAGVYLLEMVTEKGLVNAKIIIL